jgi:predicted transposase YdaD
MGLKLKCRSIQKPANLYALNITRQGCLQGRTFTGKTTFTQSELEYIRESGRIKAEYDHQTDMAEARAEARSEGHAKGRAEGRKEGRAEGPKEGRKQGLKEGQAEKAFEIARKMKDAGWPLSEIEEFTGLPQETIERIV